MSRSAAVTARVSFGPTLIMHVRADRAQAVFGREAHAVADDHPLPLQPLDAALHAGARAPHQAGQLRGRGPAVLAQGGKQPLVDGIHGISPVTTLRNVAEYTLEIVEFALQIAGPMHKNTRSTERAMKNIVVVGAGKIGSMIAELLAGCGDYEVTVIDRSAAATGPRSRRRAPRSPRSPRTSPRASLENIWRASSPC